MELFLSVVRLGSVSQAAAAHGITQPSATTRLRQLERQLGLGLLERGPSGSTPTPAGALVAEWATTLVAAAEEFAAATSTLRSQRGGRLRLAASLTIAEHLLPGWLEPLHQRFPDTKVELNVVNSAGVLDLVRADRTDIGFIESPASTKGLSATPVGADELVIVVAPSHPWARRRRPLPAADLARTPLVVREEGSGTRIALVNALATAGLGEPTPALELGSSAAVRAAAAAGTAPAVLSRLAVDAELEVGRLIEVPVEGLDLRRSLRAVRLNRRPIGDAGDALLSLARVKPSVP